MRTHVDEALLVGVHQHRELEDFGKRGVSTFLQKLGKPRFLPQVSSAMVCGVLDEYCFTETENIFP